MTIYIRYPSQERYEFDDLAPALATKGISLEDKLFRAVPKEGTVSARHILRHGTDRTDPHHVREEHDVWAGDPRDRTFAAPYALFEEFLYEVGKEGELMVLVYDANQLLDEGVVEYSFLDPQNKPAALVALIDFTYS